MRRIFCLCLFVGLAAGCSDQPQMGTVKGTITVDGMPLEKGMITFEAAGKSAASYEIKNGTYEGKAFLGYARVLINSPKVVGKHKRFQTDDSPLEDTLEESIPEKYNAMSGRQIDVKPGDNQFDLDLKLK